MEELFMAKLIVTSRYIKPNAHGKFGNYIKYIATREGVEKPVQKQEQHQELNRERHCTPKNGHKKMTAP